MPHFNIITFETAAFNTHVKVAVFVSDAPAKHHQLSVLFQNWTSLPFSSSFTLTVTWYNHGSADMSTTEHKQMKEEHSVLPTEVLSV
jgi:hypothetical protein